ncbi:MAG: hypothetical protein AAGA48_23125 [Myxococcota bacterium]
MGERRSRLASRFKKAVEKAEDARQDRERSAAEAEQLAQAARDELFGELQALAKDIGFLTVQRTKQGLTLRYGERYLHFAPDGIGDLTAEMEGTGDDVHRLYREAELGNRWVYLRKRRFRELRVPLFDQGIEELLVLALGLPRPEEGDREPDDSEGSSGGPGRRL